MDDFTPRYAPSHVTLAVKGLRDVPVTSYHFYPVGQHPEECPIRHDFGVLECRTDHGSRWYGCERAYINSELRMVVIGCDSRDEVRMKWPVCQRP